MNPMSDQTQSQRARLDRFAPHPLQTCCFRMSNSTLPSDQYGIGSGLTLEDLDLAADRKEWLTQR